MSTRKPKHDREESEERAALSTLLREAREYLGFSQDQVAKHLGIPRSALSNIENGQRRLEVVELKRLASLYQKPVTYFTGQPESPGTPLPPDVEHIAREASKLTDKDRAELARFADFLRARSSDGSAAEEK